MFLAYTYNTYVYIYTYLFVSLIIVHNLSGSLLDVNYVLNDENVSKVIRVGTIYYLA